MDILVVEPLFEKTKKLSQMVVSAGCTMDHVQTARDALNKLGDKKYGGVLVSNVLPDMSGDIFADLLKGAKLLNAPPVMVIESPDDDRLSIEDYLRTILSSGKAKEKKEEEESKPAETDKQDK